MFVPWKEASWFYILFVLNKVMYENNSRNKEYNSDFNKHIQTASIPGKLLSDYWTKFSLQFEFKVIHFILLRQFE